VTFVGGMLNLRIFTMRHYASAVYAVIVCPFVRLSITTQEFYEDG